jgi:N-acetylneuraminic acid mutarotase
MKKKLIVVYQLTLLVSVCQAQSYEWAWMTGSATSVDVAGDYGTIQQSDETNSPGSRFEASTWTDADGNLWLFGGLGEDATGKNGSLNDLWKYDVSTGNWTWMSGSNITDQYGLYGTVGVPSGDNAPGGRNGAESWIDDAGNLWLFGGIGYATSGNANYLNDLWKYNISLNEWTWVGGSKGVNQSGRYGTQGIAETNNWPGARYRLASFKPVGNVVWLFGGFGFANSGLLPLYLNDLWKYDMSTGLWTWMKGSNNTNQAGNYGTLQVSAATNTPGARYGQCGVADNAGNLWLFGGFGRSVSATNNLNDLWKFNISTNEWTWMSGSNTAVTNGVYGNKGSFNTGNYPGSRNAAVLWFNDTFIWLFGGSGNAASSNGLLNDLWAFNPANNLWAWMNGSINSNEAGTYGIQSVSNPDNTPGGRQRGCGWNDSQNRLWLFGGNGYSSDGSLGNLNDLWLLHEQNIVSVQLVSFKATFENTSTLIEWITSKETNSAHFEVEKSTDAVQWSVTEKIKAATYSTQNIYYQTYDNLPVLGSNYYRLKQVNLDGTFTHSQIAKVSVSTSLEPQLLNNPVQDKITITNTLATQKIRIYTSEGKLLVDTKGTDRETKIDIINYPKGLMYIVIIDSNNNRIKSMKVIKN